MSLPKSTIKSNANYKQWSRQRRIIFQVRERLVIREAHSILLSISSDLGDFDLGFMGWLRQITPCFVLNHGNKAMTWE